VHDYHLIPLAGELRKLGVTQPIGFFLHTPFPPAEVLSVLPGHQALLEALCQYDLVGLQTDENVRAFMGSIVNLVGGYDLGDGVFSAFGQCRRVGAFPVGIDVDDFAAIARQAVNSVESRQLTESLSGRSLIIGIDRLDYSKGIGNRFDAVDALLTDHPEYRSVSAICRSRPIRAKPSPPTARRGVSSRRRPAGSTASSPSSTGRRSATSTGISHGEPSPASCGSRASPW